MTDTERELIHRATERMFPSPENFNDHLLNMVNACKLEADEKENIYQRLLREVNFDNLSEKNSDTWSIKESLRTFSDFNEELL